MPSSFLQKKYNLVRSENFDAYMKELGVGFTLRKMGNTICSQCLLTKNDNDIYTFWLKTPLHCHKINFQRDKPFVEVTIDNRVVRTTCSLNGNIFVQEQQSPGLKTTKIVREYRNNGNDLITTMFVGDVKAVRYYVDTKEKARTLDDNIPVQKHRVKLKKTVRKYKSKGSKLSIKPSAKAVMAEKLTETKPPITMFDENIYVQEQQEKPRLTLEEKVGKSGKHDNELLTTPLVENVNSVRFNEDANETEQRASGSKPMKVLQKSDAKLIDSVLVEDIADQKKDQKPKAQKIRKCC